MKPAFGFLNDVMNVATSFIPPAVLAFATELAQRSLRPRAPRFVAMLSTSDRVTLPFIPRAITFQPPPAGFAPQASAGFCSGISLKIVRLNNCLAAAITFAPPENMTATVNADWFDCHKPAISMPLKRLEITRWLPRD